MKPTKCTLFLKSIQYSGDNVGDDLVFSFRAFKTIETFNLQLKHGDHKIFTPPKLVAGKSIAKPKESIRFLMTIEIMEKDESIDDHGEKKQYHAFPVEIGEKFEFEQTVVVEETRNRKLLNGQFTCRFELLFSEEEPAIIIDHKLPILAVPIPITNRAYSAYMNLGSCDLDCLSKSGLSQQIMSCVNNGRINLRCVSRYDMQALNSIYNCCNS